MLLTGLRSLKRSRTKSFSRILAARKLEQEQKIDEAGGGASGSACNTGYNRLLS